MDTCPLQGVVSFESRICSCLPPANGSSFELISFRVIAFFLLYSLSRKRLEDTSHSAKFQPYGPTGYFRPPFLTQNVANTALLQEISVDSTMRSHTRRFLLSQLGQGGPASGDSSQNGHTVPYRKVLSRSIMVIRPYALSFQSNMVRRSYLRSLFVSQTWPFNPTSRDFN